MSDSLKEMFEKNRLSWDRLAFVNEGWINVGEVSKDVFTGKKSMVDVEAAKLRIEHDADYKTIRSDGSRLKSAREILGDVIDKKNVAVYNCNTEKAKAYQKIIDDYKPKAFIELLARKR